jgi:PERQ amino acid-rich with GYF domain-containing protein
MESFAHASSQRERQIVSSSGARVDGDAAAAGHDDAQASAGGSSGDSLLQHTASVLNALSLDDDPPVGSGSFADDSRDVEAPTSDPAAPPPWSADTAQWYYRDPSGQDQGPFAATIMQDWFQQNYFALDLPMRRAEEESFRPLGEIIASLGHPAQPFLVPPPAPAPAPEPQQAQQQPEHDVFSHGNQPSQQQHQANGLGEHHAGHPYDALGQPAGSDLSRGGWGGAGLPASVQARGWPSLDLGFGAQPGQQMSGFGGPHSPFVQAPQSPFGAAPLFGAGGLRGQDDYLAMVRQRELQEQRQAAAAAAARGHAGPGLGFATPYGGDFGGHAAGNGWEASAPGGWNAATAHLHHQQPDVFGTPQHQHQQQHQQQGQAASGSPWGTPARQFGTAPQQPQYHFQQPQQVPWSDSSAHQQAEAQLHKSDPEPIGTPRRSRTPVEEASSQQQDFAEQQQQQQEEAFAQQQRDAQQQEEEEAQRRAEQERQERETAVMLQQQEAAHAEPEPEEVWPQSPTAVEFAAEPPLPAHHEQQNNLMDDGPATSSRKRSRRKGQQTRAEEAAGAPMPTADLSSYAGADVGKRQAPPSAAGGNVKVVSQEQFKRPGGAEEDSKNQAPLSAWLPDSGSNTPTTSKAPWAAATESSASAPGLTLREIQEAEARQAESRRAAERALAAQRARSMASGDDTLPATMTWGLATGHASQGSSAPEPAADAAASASPAPWSAARPTAKKTLTEIQEEERKRAQKARDAQAAQQAALRRGYADSAGKTQVPPPAAAASGAWSVVGSKPASAVPASARPPATPVGQRAASLGATPPVGVWATAGAKQNGTPAAKVQSPVIKTKMVVAPSASSEQLGSGQPSADFLRYCKEQLKGLNVKGESARRAVNVRLLTCAPQPTTSSRCSSPSRWTRRPTSSRSSPSRCTPTAARSTGAASPPTLSPSASSTRAAAAPAAAPRRARPSAPACPTAPRSAQAAAPATCSSRRPSRPPARPTLAASRSSRPRAARRRRAAEPRRQQATSNRISFSAVPACLSLSFVNASIL